METTTPLNSTSSLYYFLTVNKKGNIFESFLVPVHEFDSYFIFKDTETVVLIDKQINVDILFKRFQPSENYGSFLIGKQKHKLEIYGIFNFDPEDHECWKYLIEN